MFVTSEFRIIIWSPVISAEVMSAHCTYRLNVHGTPSDPAVRSGTGVVRIALNPRFVVSIKAGNCPSRSTDFNWSRLLLSTATIPVRNIIY